MKEEHKKKEGILEGIKTCHFELLRYDCGIYVQYIY